MINDINSGAYGCFNRTFMELKLAIHHLLLPSSLRFNRTFMELKFATGDLSAGCKFTF